MRSLATLFLVSAAVSVRAVYKLRFLGDYQNGDWDSDAAENLAYDIKTHRAFVASAESQDIQVIEMEDPTSPVRTATLSVSSNIETRCMEQDCIYEQMDFGGPDSKCGAAQIVLIASNSANFTCCSGFYSGEFLVDPTMTSPEACQQKCAETTGCSFFSYEDECELGSDGTCTGTRYHECFMKAAYGEAVGGDDCIDYVAWEDGPQWDLHSYDPDWYAAAGPAACGFVRSESVQGVGVISVDGYENAIVAAAAPHLYEWADGYLAFFDAKELFYMGCAPAGNKPEGLVADPENARLSCINEGSARSDGLLDHAGSATICDIIVENNPTVVNFDCSTYLFVEENFADGAFVPAAVFRSRDLRLFGPDGDSVEYDLEPEHGFFVDNGNFLLVSLQDNNGYAFLDIATRKYTYLGGYTGLPATMDASDRDGYINIKDTWGSGTSVTALAMPDQIFAVAIDGVQYVLTANEGDTRDGGDIIGNGNAVDGTEIEGEESRLGDLGSPSVASCADGCSDDAELGRILTTVFMPTDFATNACGGNACTAQELADALDDSAFSCIYYNYDYGRDTGGCDFAEQPADAYTVSSSAWSPPSWYTDSWAVDENMLTPSACQAACAAAASCDFFTFEFEEGVGECLFKLALQNCPYDSYHRWAQKWDDIDWVGASGPGTCPFARPPYDTDIDPTDTTGSPGGAYSIGGRSFTIWKMIDGTTPLELVWDSTSMFEEASALVNNGLCDGCDVSGAPETCLSRCPFNCDHAPPDMDDRSDAKGPEPECVTAGQSSDGALLAFIGLERTGGIVVYDISNPETPVFQDFLNVRNWLVDDAVPDEDSATFGNFMVNHALNDGPESLVFLPAADSPIGQDMLIAVAPLAGRVTAYLIEQGDARGNDGSCMNIATCPYLSTSVGGTGEARTLTFADVCAGDACSTTTTEEIIVQEKKKSSSNNSTLIFIIIMMVVLLVFAIFVACIAMIRFKKEQEKYRLLSVKNALHEGVEIPDGKA